MIAHAPVHATTVARREVRGWRGAVITGPSGAGKSDLALRLMARGWRLVSDDYTLLWASDGVLYAAPPARIAGRMEVRGVGVVGADVRPLTRVVLALGCVAHEVERLPPARSRRLAGLDIPFLEIDPRLPSAVEIVAVAMQTL